MNWLFVWTRDLMLVSRTGTVVPLSAEEIAGQEKELDRILRSTNGDDPATTPAPKSDAEAPAPPHPGG